MTAKLSDDLRNALDQQQGQPLKIEDDKTNNVYVLLDANMYYSLVQQEDLASIQRGIDQMEAGQGRSLHEADADLRRKLGFSPPS